MPRQISHHVSQGIQYSSTLMPYDTHTAGRHAVNAPPVILGNRARSLTVPVAVSKNTADRLSIEQSMRHNDPQMTKAKQKLWTWKPLHHTTETHKL
mmetsp:Transcript_64497/g.108071  ORF Transcript_64497/g.108071 Transcript_64497/m.108071 type:complete len:96 (+) Transcript_64497:219-506(+)